MMSWSQDPWQTLRNYQVILDIIRKKNIKQDISRILDRHFVRAANRYFQFYQILAVFGSVRSWSLK